MACEPNRVRLLCMLSLTFGFFIVEVVVSRMTASLSMLSDSFHMLSDVIALVVALVAVRFAEKTHATNKNTFGWIRAEVMGALINAVFLTALCFTIVLEAIERFTEPHEIESPQVVVGVGAAGLLVNLLGLCLFHGHAGGGHGHSHGGHSHEKKNKRFKTGKSQKAGDGSSGTETSNLVGNHNSPGDVRAKNGKKGELAHFRCSVMSVIVLNSIQCQNYKPNLSVTVCATPKLHCCRMMTFSLPPFIKLAELLCVIKYSLVNYFQWYKTEFTLWKTHRNLWIYQWRYVEA